jgi:hypothetical protein
MAVAEEALVFIRHGAIVACMEIHALHYVRCLCRGSRCDT